jgi:hypothetical protein
VISSYSRFGKECYDINARVQSVLECPFGKASPFLSANLTLVVDPKVIVGWVEEERLRDARKLSNRFLTW